MEGGALVGSSKAIFAAAGGLRALCHIVSDQPGRDLCPYTHLWVVACHPLAKTACSEKRQGRHLFQVRNDVAEQRQRCRSVRVDANRMLPC
jgi:hypothetical protein